MVALSIFLCQCWFVGYLLQLADKGICLSYDSVNLTVIIRGCNATDIKQRFEYDPVSHLIKYVGKDQISSYVHYNGMYTCIYHVMGPGYSRR